MDVKYKLSCAAYISEYKKTAVVDKHSLEGWYHFIDNPKFNTVGVVATAEILILIKKLKIDVSFDCKPIINSLLYMQHPDGGWSYSSNVHKSAAEPTARSIQALLLWDELLATDERQAIQKGIEWLLKYKNKSSLWGPINKKEKDGYIYFSCVVLQALQEVLLSKKEYISTITTNSIDQTINNAITVLLNCFDNNDIQCGWGITNVKEPTVFHTAYVLYTILSIDPSYIKKHQIIKSLEFLKEYFLNNEQHVVSNYDYSIGESEIYQYNTFRLFYTHSVDVYTVLALLQDPSSLSLQPLLKKCMYYVGCAEKTDWRYREYITCWRLFDVVTLCNFYTNLLNGSPTKKMKHFKVAFTFAGESRELVRKLAEELSKVFDKSEILYDEYHKADFARPQLDIYLQNLYHNCSDLIVVVLCENYTHKRWCGVEWRSVRDILNNFDYQKIMYIKATDKDIDDVHIPGFYGSEDGYIDANEHAPEEIVNMIIERYNGL